MPCLDSNAEEPNNNLLEFRKSGATSGPWPVLIGALAGFETGILFLTLPRRIIKITEILDSSYYCLGMGIVVTMRGVYCWLLPYAGAAP